MSISNLGILEHFDVRLAVERGDLSRIGACTHKVASGNSVKLKPIHRCLMEPTVADPAIRALAGREMAYPDYFILEISDVKILGNNILIKDGIFFHDKLLTDKRKWLWGPGQNDLQEIGDSNRFSSRRSWNIDANIAGTSIVINSTGAGHNYHHWLVDCMPLFEAASRFKGKIDNFLVPKNVSESFLQIADLFGLERDRIVHYEPNSKGVVRLENIIHPSPLSALNEWVRPEFASFLRSALSREQDPSSPKKIYLSRLDARQGLRVLLNERELADALHSLGFEIIRMSDHSFLEQVRLVTNADIIVGLHGAAMANLIFASQGANVLLVEHEHKGYTFYRHISELVGFNYSVVIGDTFVNDANSIPRQNQDWIVDVDKVLRVIKSF